MSTALQPTITTRRRPSTAQVVFAFALVYIFWGSTYLGISVAVRQIPPALMCAARFLAAGSLMLAWCVVTGKRITIDMTEAWRLALIGVLLLVGGNTSVAWSEQYTPSGVSALIVAIVPLWVVLLERFTGRGERLFAGGLLVLIIGIGGLAVRPLPEVPSGPAGRRWV